eukprot:2964-Heterococcus_DN1.PRE.1
MHGISMSPSGMANVMNTHKFNPMIEYFTYVKDPASVVTSSTSNGSNDGGSFKDLMAPPPTSTSPTSSSGTSSSNTALITVQEMTVEPKFAVSLPLQLLKPLYTMLKGASQAWQGRLEMERKRQPDACQFQQGYFATNAEAFHEGRILVKINIAEGRYLDGIASKRDESITDNITSQLNTSHTTSNGSSTSNMHAANSDGSTFNSPTNTSFSDNSTSNSSSSGSGSSSAYVSMKTLSDVKKFGGKAMALAKNATQANVTRQLGALNSKTTDKQLKACNFYARVAYINNTSATDTASTTANNSASVDRAHVRLIGKTNTEYCTASPVWGTNSNKSACPHNQPRLQHMITGSARAEAAAANSTNSDILPIDSGKFLLQGIDLSFYVKASDLPTEAALHYTL